MRDKFRQGANASTSDIQRAADQRKVAAADQPDPRRAQSISALQQERLGYVRRGLPDRVAQVDAQLERLDAEPAEVQAPVEDESVDEPSTVDEPELAEDDESVVDDASADEQGE